MSLVSLVNVTVGTVPDVYDPPLPISTLVTLKPSFVTVFSPLPAESVTVIPALVE